MKQTNKYLLLGALSLLTFSCNKENEVLKDTVKTEPKTEMTTIYTASTDFFGYKVKAYNNDEDENLRTQIISQGYREPKLGVTQEEFSTHNLPLNFGVIGNGKFLPIQRVENLLSTVPTQTNPVTQNSFLIRNENDATRINLYAKLDAELIDKTFVWMALDGRAIYGDAYLLFARDGDTAPNALIKGIKNGEIDNGRHFPIMTDLVPSAKMFAPATKKTIKFKPRGSLVSICVINKLFEDITLKEFKIEKDNALYFEGAFNSRIDMDNTEYEGLQSSSNDLTEAPLLFMPTPNETDHTFPIKNDANARLAKVDPSKSLAELKANLPLFNVWGFPRNKNAIFKIKITYTRGSDTDIWETKTLTFPVPQEGFKEGFAYQLPIVLEEPMPQTGFGGPNPLDFVSEFPVNQAGDNFVTSHNISREAVIANRQSTDAGFFTWNQAKTIFDANPTFLEDYTFPTRLQLMSIAPYHILENYVAFKNTESSASLAKRSLQQMAQVGNKTDSYNSDFISKQEGALYVTYALRFKGTKWESAWRYTYQGAENDKKVIIECVGGLKDSGLALEDIAHYSFFEVNTKTTRTFACHGDAKHPSYTELNFIGSSSSFWSSDESSDGTNSYLITFYWWAMHTGADKKYEPATIRPFYKELP